MGVDLLIETSAAIAPSDPRCQLVIAGPHQLGWQAALEQRAAALGNADRGLELSPSQVQQAQLHGCTAAVLGDALAALEALPDGSLDLVTCFDAFEHLAHGTCAQ